MIAPHSGVPVPPTPVNAGYHVVPDGRAFPTEAAKAELARPPTDPVTGRIRCDACGFSVKPNDWVFHSTSVKHQWMIRRREMEKSGLDGVTEPPKGEHLPLNHVWCGVCQKAVGAMGNLWRQHVTGGDHITKAFTDVTMARVTKAAKEKNAPVPKAPPPQKRRLKVT